MKKLPEAGKVFFMNLGTAFELSVEFPRSKVSIPPSEFKKIGSELVKSEHRCGLLNLGGMLSSLEDVEERVKRVNRNWALMGREGLAEFRRTFIPPSEHKVVMFGGNHWEDKKGRKFVGCLYTERKEGNVVWRPTLSLSPEDNPYQPHPEGAYDPFSPECTLWAVVEKIPMNEVHTTKVVVRHSWKRTSRLGDGDDINQHR